MRKIICTFSILSCLVLFNSCETPVEPSNNEKAPSKTVDSSDVSEIDQLNEAIQNNPKNALAYIARGNYFLNNKDFIGANNDFADAYKLDSNNTEVMLTVADFLPYLNKPAESFRLYNKVLANSPKNKKAYLGIARIFYYVGNPQKSFAYIDSSLMSDRKYRDAYMLKAMIFRKEGDTKNAISSYQTALEQDPNYIPGYVALGNVYANNNPEMALNYFNSALDIDSTDLEAIYGKALVLQNEQRNEEAIQTYKSMIRNHPENPNSYHNIGFIYLENLNNLDSAKKYFTRSIEVDSLFIRGYHNLGASYDRAGNKQRAKSLYLKALELNPEFETSKNALKSLD